MYGSVGKNMERVSKGRVCGARLCFFGRNFLHCVDYGEEFLATTSEAVYGARANGRGDGYGVSANHCAAGEARCFLDGVCFM